MVARGDALASGGLAVEVRPKAATLDFDASCLSVLSYNLLAPAFVRPVDKRTGAVQPYAAFQWAEPAAEVLDWEIRQPRLLAELQNANADVLCLQEVQFEQLPNGEFLLPAWLKLEGYDAKLPSQSSLGQMAERNQRVLGNPVAIGCVVLFRSDRLQIFMDPVGVSHPNTLVGVCLLGIPGSSLAHLGKTIVFSVHLDAQGEPKRVEQLCKCLALARQFGVREMIVAGDLNTELLPGSCVEAFLAGATLPSSADLTRECASALRLATNNEGACYDEDAPATTAESFVPAVPSKNGVSPSEEQLADWTALWRKAADAAKEYRIEFVRMPSGQTRCGYDHGKDSGPCVAWRIDHILYTVRTLTLRSSWATLETDPTSLATGLPNHKCPSDHLPIAAVFSTAATPALSIEEERILLQRVETLELNQKSELLKLEEAITPRIPQGSMAVETNEHPGESGGKKQRKKAERPSPEMQALIQDERRRRRELKEVHKTERARFVHSLSELELDSIERLVNLTAWMESGAR